MKALSNARWVSVSQAARIISQLVSITVLARLLPPEAYGLMAMAAVVTNLAYMFRDMGSGAAVIQAPQVSASLAATLHWSNVAFGISITLLMAIFSPLIAHLFHEPELVQVLCLLALIFPLSSLGVVRQALIERESRFALMAVVEVAAAFSGLMVALLMAWQGAGVYSLVGQMLVATLVTTGMLAWVSDFRPALRWHWLEFKSIAGFSGNLSMFNVVLYLSRNADSMVIGRLLGSASLGIYSVAYRVMLFPVQNMSYVASRALYPVMSRQQDDIAAMSALYLKTIGFIAFLTAPLMAGLFALREPFVLTVFGSKWLAAVNVLAWLAPVGFLQSVVSTTGTVFMARGRTDLMLYLGVLATVLQVAAFVIGSRWGIEGVAAAYLAANLINALPALYFSGKLIGVSLADLLRTLMFPLAGAVVMAVVLLAAQQPVTDGLRNALQSLLLLAALGAAVYAAASALLLRPQLLQLRLFLRLGKG
jgi:O-antigen/teichoic acid export membrane protein